MTDTPHDDCTRRTFVRAAGTTVGVMAVSGCQTGKKDNSTLASGSASLAHTDGDDKIRVGLIGCGGRGSGGGATVGHGEVVFGLGWWVEADQVRRHNA